MRKASVLTAVIVALVAATILWSLSGHHQSWDCWPWNFCCFVVAVLGVDLMKGRQLSWW
jgi:hypothetical protein